MPEIREISITEFNLIMRLVAEDKAMFGIADKGDLEDLEDSFFVSIADYTCYLCPSYIYFSHTPGLVINVYPIDRLYEERFKDNSHITFEDLLKEVTSSPRYDAEAVQQVKTLEEVRLVLEAERDLGLFFFTYNDGKEAHDGGWYPNLNMNDTFAFACADAEPIKFSDIPKLFEINAKYSYQGINAWVALRRGYDVLEMYRKENYLKAKEELKNAERP